MDYNKCLEYDAVESGYCKYDDLCIAQALWAIAFKRDLQPDLNEVLEWCYSKYGGTLEQAILRALTNLL